MARVTVKCCTLKIANPHFLNHRNFMHSVTLIKGDGIGPSIMDEAVKIINASGAKNTFFKTRT
jgi:hypothetical protein